MKRIYKYPLEFADDQRIMLPRGAQVLCVQVQNDTPCIWAIVNDDQSIGVSEVRFRVYGTGHPIDEDMSGAPHYLGTFQLAQGALVFHVFHS